MATNRVFIPRVTSEEIEKALIENDYQISKVSQVLGYSRVEYLKKRIEHDERLRTLIQGKEQYKRGHTKTKIEDFIKAIYEARGNKNTIAKILGLDIASVYSRIRQNPVLQEHVFLASETQKDIAEMKLYELIEQGNLDAIKFYLSRQARDRGYGDKLEFTASVDINNNWNLQVLGVNELLMLESLAEKALQKGEEVIADYKVITPREEITG